MGLRPWTTFFHVALAGITSLTFASSYTSSEDQYKGLGCPLASSVPLDGVSYDKCSELTDGYYADYNSGCHDYFRCHGGDRFNYSCGTTMRYNMLTGSCEETSVCLLPSCASRQPGFLNLVPGSNCKLFLRCSTSIPTVHYCPAGHLFNVATSSCTPQSTTVCLSDEPDKCSGKADGCYPDIHSGCRSYFHCCNGTLNSELHCPVNQIFDVTRHSCVPSTVAKCLQYREVDDNARCALKPDGYRVVPQTGCRTFQLCKGGTAVSSIHMCPTGKVFDESKQCCLERSAVSCPADEDSLCENLKDSYYPDLSSGCKNFHYCKNGRLIARLSCAKDRVFDPSIGHCTDESTGRCPTVEPGPESECSGLSDGYHVDVQGGCRRLLQCQKGSKVSEQSCPPGQLYDRVKLDCNPEHLTQCPKANKCLEKPDGYYPNQEDNCQSYYLCQDSRDLVTLRCSAGTLFDEKSGSCVRKDWTICRGGALGQSVPNSKCWGRSDGLYPDTAKGCREYFRCVQGKTVSKTQCPKHHLFQGNIQKCVLDTGFKCVDDGWFCGDIPDGIYPDYSANCRYSVQCQTGSKARYVTSKNDTECDPGRISCSGVPDGYYPDHSTGCRTFYRCQRGVQVLQGTCPGNLVFNGQFRTCQNPPLTEPPSSMCSNKQNGFYPDRNTNCSRFYVCVENRMVQTVDCPQGHLFDSATQSCLPSEEASCLVPMEDKQYDCSDKFGFYADVGDNCRGFFVCLPGNQSLGYQCPNGQLYSENTKKCDVESVVECVGNPTRQVAVGDSFSCRDKPDGYYTDVSSGCHKWYECQSGEASAYQCPTDRVFNILLRQCDHPTRVECVNESWVFKNYTAEVHLIPQARTATDIPTEVQLNCTGVSNGIYVNVQKGSCLSVSVCVNGDSTTVSCPPDKLTVRNCILDGISVDPDDQCRSFNICSQGVQTSHRCPEDLVFSTKLRRCVTATDDNLCLNQVKYASLPLTTSKVSQFRTPPDPETLPPAPFDCTGKADGYYPDYGQRCHVFYRCVRQRKFSHYCKIGFLFNPLSENCDFEENVKCEEPR